MSVPNFTIELSGGHHNSLGNTVEVVEKILTDTALVETLYNTYQSEDAVVRMRVSNAFKRVAKAKPAWVVPFIDRFLSEIAQLDQASAQWTLAQLLLTLEKHLTITQLAKAKKILQRNLAEHDDWIVLNQTMNTLAKWAKKDAVLKAWLLPHLDRLAANERKSVAGRATKLKAQLNK